MPDPCSYDSESDFVSACIAERQDENPGEDTEQSAAICYNIWRDRDCPKAMKRSKFKPAGTIIKVGEALSVGEREAIFIASTSTPDRVGDVVEQNWDLKAFKKNPILLFQHNSHALPIGKVKQIWTEQDGNKTFAKVEATPEGMDATADKVWRFIKTGFLNAVSVGFRPIEEPKERVDEKSGRWLGWIFPRNELLELSVVSVPANQEAIAVARSLNLSERDIKDVFEKPNGVHARANAAKRYAYIERLRVSN